MSATSEREGGTWLPLAGFAIGFLASWCGIGGGLFAVPILHFARGFPLKRAVGTGLVLVLATALAATLTELSRPHPALTARLVAPLVAGVLVGAPLGFAALQRVQVTLLRRIFVVVLAVASWRVLAGRGAEAPASAGLDAAALLVVGLVGLGGGFVAPLVGVGGGLLMVPGLYLLVGGVGFDEARAASLAAAVFAATRSLSMHARAGRVAWRTGIRFGLGALLGAGAGVGALGRWGLVLEARTLLGIVLALVALRFLVDVLRPAQA